jgi:predicted enzyme related to lactoylglutathione lyase
MHKFQHMELNTNDPEGAKTFYNALFGWQYEGFPMASGVYWMTRTADGDGLGGIMQKPMAEAPSAWLGYVTVPSVRDVIEKVRAHGGQVVVDYQLIPDMGAFAVFLDPQGAAFAVWESVRKPEDDKKAEKKAKKAAKKADKAKRAKDKKGKDKKGKKKGK